MNAPALSFAGNRAPLAELYADLAERVAELCATDLPIMVPDDATAAMVAAVGKDANALVKKLAETHKTEKEPWLAGGRACDAFFKALSVQVDGFLGQCKSLVGAYQERKAIEERARREAEAKAARDAAEAAAAAMQTEADFERAIAADTWAGKARVATQAKPAELARVTSGGYAVAQQRTTWTYEVTDLGAVPREWLQINDAKVKAALQVHKGALAIPGIRPVERKATVF